MKSIPRSTSKSLLKRSAVAVAMVALSASASALPVFTLNPFASGLGVAGNSFTADNILISDYATVRFDGLGGFTESGYLAISGAQLGGNTLAPAGLNSNYGMYIAFTGKGTTGTGNPTLVGTNGNFSILNYTLYGYNGTATFGFDGSNNPTETATGEVALATGSLVSGTVSTSPVGDEINFTPTAAARLTFAAAANTSGTGKFFGTPIPFYTSALSSFTNTESQVFPITGGFKISQGGGSFNFVAAPIPEPETYALLLAGLGAVGFVARRRRSAR